MKNLSILAKSLDKIGLQVYTVYIKGRTDKRLLPKVK